METKQERSWEKYCCYCKHKSECPGYAEGFCCGAFEREAKESVDKKGSPCCDAPIIKVNGERVCFKCSGEVDKKQPNPDNSGESVRDELISDIFSDRIRSIIEKETLEKVKVRLQNVKVMSYFPVCEVVGLYFREIQKMIYEIEETGGSK